MLKNKTNRLTSTIVLASLLTSILPISLPLNAQAALPPGETMQQKLSPQEINQKINVIKTFTKLLKIAKIAAPTLVLGAAVAGIVTVATAVIALFFLIPALKRNNAIKKMPSRLETELKDLVESNLVKKYVASKGTDDPIEIIKAIKSDNKFALGVEWPTKKSKTYDLALKKIDEAMEKITENFSKDVLKMHEDVDKGLKILKKKRLSNPELEAMTFEVIVKDKILKSSEPLDNAIKTVLKPKLKKLGTFAGISGVIAVLFGLAGTVMAPIGIAFGLTPLFATKTFDAFNELETIEKNNPGTLTPQQNMIIATFKKQINNPISRGIIKNLRLKGILTKLVDTAIKNNPSLVKKIGKEKQARKIFARYIKAKRREKLFQKTVDEFAALKLSGVKASITKFQLKRKKKKIAKLGAKYPGIQAALETAVQKYIESANSMLKKLKKSLMEEADTKEFKQQLQALQQIVPLN